MHTHSRAQRLSRAQFDQGDLADPLHTVLALAPTALRIRPTGVDEAVEWLELAK